MTRGGIVLSWGGGILVVAAGCQGDWQLAGGGGKAATAELYLPRRIEILPFTKVRSFDDDAIPDGIEVVLRPIDSLGDAIKTYGQYHFEVYEYRKGSAQRKGERVGFWQVGVGTMADQRRFWDRITRTYQFRLSWDRPLQPGRKYVLQVTYWPPSGKRLFAEHVLEFRLAAEQIRQVLPGR
ncbi:MAG: hypothetical protein ACE5K7_06330 [Phycisphaerae bacterium]